MNRERSLSGYVRGLANALSQQLGQNVEALGLTPAQGMFLHRIWYCQEVLQQATCAKDLEQFFSIRHSTVSGILQRMEAAGFLTFEVSELDHRRKCICLTQKAWDAHAQTERLIQKNDARLVAGMTEEERLEFRRLLKLAAKSMGVFECAPFPQPEKEV